MSDDDWDQEETEVNDAKQKRNFLQMLQQNVNDPNLKAAPCKVCGKNVEISQQLKIDNFVFHRSCLKCKVCNKVLSLGNYASNDGVYYCKPHFLQLFQTKGNYDEGFGKEQHKKKWESPENSSEQKTATSSSTTTTTTTTTTKTTSPSSTTTTSSTPPSLSSPKKTFGSGKSSHQSPVVINKNITSASSPPSSAPKSTSVNRENAPVAKNVKSIQVSETTSQLLKRLADAITQLEARLEKIEIHFALK